MKVKYLERDGELFVYNPLLAARKGFKEVEVEVEDPVAEAPAKKPKQKPVKDPVAEEPAE